MMEWDLGWTVPGAGLQTCDATGFGDGWTPRYSDELQYSCEMFDVQILSLTHESGDMNMQIAMI